MGKRLDGFSFMEAWNLRAGDLIATDINDVILEVTRVHHMQSKLPWSFENGERVLVEVTGLSEWPSLLNVLAMRSDAKLDVKRATGRRVELGG